MFKGIIKFFDFVISLILAIIFLFILAIILFFSKFKKKKQKNYNDIIQLYITILDFRNSPLSAYKEAILLNGFIKRLYCYHFDFDEIKDENVRISNDIYMYNISVHPDNPFVKAGLRKTVACLVEIKTFFMMLKTIIQKNVNVIRAHDPHLLGFNAYVLSRLTNIPFIVQICSNYELKDRKAKGITFGPFIFQNLEKWFEQSIMRSSDMIMTDREHYRSFGLIPKDIPEEKYANVGFFVDSVHYIPPDSRQNLRNDLNIPSNKKILLYVGRFSKVKYPLDLLKMLQRCLEMRKDIILVVAGKGLLEDQMKKMVYENKIDDYVLFLEKLPQDKIKDLYYTADIVCFTSAGFTMIEAALAQKCIVAYDFEWHSEFIGKNERGILVPFGDYCKFAEEVLRVIEDFRLREKLGKEARSYALKHYLRKDSVEREIGFYKKLFNK